MRQFTKIVRKTIIIICLLLTCQFLTAQDLKSYTTQQVLDAIIEVESKDGKYTYNRYEPYAAGILQQFPDYVKDVNRIIGMELYTLEDRNDPKKAKEMFWIYSKHYCPSLDPEKIIRIQCGGPDGWKEDCTLKYLELVKNALKESK